MSTRLGQDEAIVWRLELAGRLHDIGKIVVPEGILTKPSALSEEEWLLLREHPEHGAKLARMVPGFDGVAESIRQHHERFDGTGYPLKLRSGDIRLEARIIAVCDSWAAMRSDRPYQSALTEEQAREELWSGRGTQFDPDLVDLFLDLHDQGLVGQLRLVAPRTGEDQDPVGSVGLVGSVGSVSSVGSAGSAGSAISAVSAKVFQKLIS
jgi:HD-GYP domain-containing protein (c-di-GMP phosphodiesterase class II)